MNLYSMLTARAERGHPVRVGLIGAGKFGAMFLAQARRMRGIHVLGIADLGLERAHQTLRQVGWSEERFDVGSFEQALRSGKTLVTDDAGSLIAADGLDIVIEATGDPVAGVRHCLRAVEHGRHVVMVNVEADALAGPLLAHQASRAGLVYSLAWGDQPS
ncbi:MAG: hypothetical protein JSV66_10780 [Trueperaceae bacterium]|nr:MAG: hypothetical protein JSV66_10780 [Trueperaceae bacterium]